MTKYISTLMLGIMLAAASPAWSQSGSITGTVRDTSNNPEPGFSIVIENEATEERFETTTDDDGAFTFVALPPGDYVLITDVGQENAVRFSTSIAGPIDVRLMSSTGGGGPPAVTAEVQSISMAPEHVSAWFSRGVIAEAVQPDWINPNGDLFGAYNLSLLAEAIRPPLEGDPFVGPGVGGRPGDTNSFMINGVDNNNRVMPGPLLYLPESATQEFTLQQNAGATGSTHITGGQFQSIIIGGTNQWHGAAYWYMQNRQLNARDSQLDRFELDDKPRFDRNRFGGRVSMPIVENKLFGSLNLEYTPFGFTRYAPGSSFAPTAQGLNLLQNNPRISQRNLALLRQSGEGSGSSGQTQTIAGTTVPLGVAQTGVSGSRNTWAGSATIDFVANQQNRLSAHYVQNEIESSISGDTLPAFSTPNDTQALMGSIGYTHTNGGNYVNELRVGYNRFDSGYNPGTFAMEGGEEGTMPFLSIQGADLNLGARYPFQQSQFNTYHISDVASWRLGRHDLKFGGDARKVISSQSGFPQANGVYTYSSLERFLLDDTPDVSAQRAFGDPTLNANQWIVDGFVQDRFQLMSRLTMEAGLHYQWAELPEFARRQDLNSGLNADGVATFDRPGTDNYGFGPRLGVAFAPVSNLVFRAGGGMQYDTLYLSNRLGRTLGPQSELATLSDPIGGGALSSGGFLGSGGIARSTEDRARLGTFIPDQKLPYTIHWNAGVQGGISKNFTASVRYIGNRSVRQPRFSTANPNNFVTADRNLPVFFGAPTQSQLSNLSLTLNDIQNLEATPTRAAGFTNPIFGLDPVGTSWYHAGIAEINHRMTRGVQMSARYTLSDLQLDGYGNQLDLGLPRNGHFNAPFNPDHRLTLSGVADVGAMFPNGGWLTNIVANLSVMGTYTYMSDISTPLTNSLDTGFSGVGMSSNIFENPDGDTRVSSGVSPIRNNAGNIVAYRADNPNARFVRGGLGSYSTGQSFLDLDQVQNFDVAAAKKFTFFERTTMEVRAEAYNVFNSRQITGVALHGFLTPQITGQLTPGQLVAGSNNFGDIGSLFSSNPRTMQLALRMTF